MAVGGGLPRQVRAQRGLVVGIRQPVFAQAARVVIRGVAWVFVCSQGVDGGGVCAHAVAGVRRLNGLRPARAEVVPVVAQLLRPHLVQVLVVHFLAIRQIGIDV